jgi:transcriptional regulator with XRE-family HTH domain
LLLIVVGRVFGDTLSRTLSAWNHPFFMTIHSGNNIKLIRELHNFTQTYVALKIDICEKTYRKIEKSNEMPNEKIIILLEKFYNIELKNFLQLNQDELIKKITL